MTRIVIGIFLILIFFLVIATEEEKEEFDFIGGCILLIIPGIILILFGLRFMKKLKARLLHWAQSVNVTIGCYHQSTDHKEHLNGSTSWKDQYILLNYDFIRPLDGIISKNFNCNRCGKEIRIKIASHKAILRRKVIGISIIILFSIIFLFQVWQLSIIILILGFAWYLSPYRDCHRIIHFYDTEEERKHIWFPPWYFIIKQS